MTSVLKMLMDGNLKINTLVCGIDGSTTAIPTELPVIITSQARILRVDIDVGGYCNHCCAARCGDHSIWVASPYDQMKTSLNQSDMAIDMMITKAYELGKTLDLVFLLGCRQCEQVYIPNGGLRNFILAD